MSAPRISFEFFPPKTLDASFRLWETTRMLAPLRPDFVSVTYGAGGTTRQLTHEAVTTIGREFNLNVAAHLTCVDASREETLAIADAYAKAGVSEIVALRGDPPKGQGAFAPREDGFASSLELISALKDTGNFTLRVGAYPERHPEAGDDAADIEWLKRKFEAGADSAITQFFFEAETFLRFRDKAEKAGIDAAKIIPGIIPIEGWTGIRRFALATGATVPAWLDEAFEKAARDNREQLLATALCTELCDDLLAEGVPALHFYTLNKAVLTRDVCYALGVTPQVALQNVA
ncbi:methylenetetrahydrofolate reductase [NAD(P)H] [Pararhodobacter sp. CCB-MM2]|uniref:methylenetetrahydrofolate reductase [NAD(P)H] n=1 Tax=Pararhodobacter sp. CCB-MM2 TaxID=1786003 RepID=UPI00082F667C|nr:methylenetetrahydrofolate reductase [NAD(P)H] [Pararhodobacter sp. CCB-MM2]